MTGLCLLFLLCVQGGLSTFGPVRKEGVMAVGNKIRPRRHFRAPSYRGFVETCDSEQCRTTAGRIRESMDASVDPCDDFFQFACGGFERKHPATGNSFQDQQFQLHLAPKSVLADLQVVLEHGHVKYPFLNRARAHYKDCLARGDRPSVCVKNTTFNYEWFLGVAYVREFSHSDNIRKAELMLDALAVEQILLVKQLAWMDERSKRRTIRKIKGLTKIVGFDRALLTDHSMPTVQTLRNGLHPLRINPVYMPLQNAIFMPLAILTTPYFNLGLDLLDYSAIGLAMSHELGHCFHLYDYDEMGNHSVIWSPETIYNFGKLSACLTQQYTSEFKDFITINSKKIGEIDATKSMNENLADNAAAKIAFRTFKRLGSKKRRLDFPGFEHFSPEQLFFLGQANVHCSSESAEFTERSIFSKHSPTRFRVNVPLQNFDEFAKAWNCPSGSQMNPEKKCVFWARK